MTKVTVNKSTNIQSIIVEGHTGFANSGSDIVCSSISSVVMFSNKLLHSMNCQYEYIADEENAIIKMNFKDYDNKCAIVLDDLIWFIQELSNDYPKNVKILFKEVK